MEVWRPEVLEGRRPKVISGGNVILAVVIHLSMFAGFYVFAAFHGLFKEDEKIIPIDLTVVVNENLDGKEDEPPPLRKPDPPAPKPKPKPKPVPKPVEKKPDEPKPLEKIVTNVVVKLEKKERKPEKKEEQKQSPKKEPPKTPDPPKETAKELREERLKKMRDSAKQVNSKVTIEVKDRPSGNGKTAKKTLTDEQIKKLLNEGYVPGRKEQLATSDLQRGYSLIKMAFESKWETPPWTDTLRPMVIRVWFGSGGKVVRYKLEQSSGDPRADQTLKSAAARVGSVAGLSPSFIDEFRTRGVPLRFEVRPQ